MRKIKRKLNSELEGIVPPMSKRLTETPIKSVAHPSTSRYVIASTLSLAVVLVCILTFVFASPGGIADVFADYSVKCEIGSMGVKFDTEELVIRDIQATNISGEIALSNGLSYTLLGMEISEATELIISRAAELGYIGEDVLNVIAFETEQEQGGGVAISEMIKEIMYENLGKVGVYGKVVEGEIHSEAVMSDLLDRYRYADVETRRSIAKEAMEAFNNDIEKQIKMESIRHYLTTHEDIVDGTEIVISEKETAKFKRFTDSNFMPATMSAVNFEKLLKSIVRTRFTERQNSFPTRIDEALTDDFRSVAESYTMRNHEEYVGITVVPLCIDGEIKTVILINSDYDAKKDGNDIDYPQ